MHNLLLITKKGEGNMPRSNENVHVNPSPHPDGDKNSVINNPLSTGSSKAGIANSNLEIAQERNPFNFVPKRNIEMEKFKQLMNGTPLNSNK